MIIRVTAGEPSLDALCEEHFGRVPFFLCMDTDSGEWRAVENRFPVPCGGKVPGAVRILQENQAEFLVTGRIGGGGQETIEAAAILVYAVPGRGNRPIRAGTIP